MCTYTTVVSMTSPSALQTTPVLLTNSSEKGGKGLEGEEECRERRNPHTLQGL